MNTAPLLTTLQQIENARQILMMNYLNVLSAHDGVRLNVVTKFTGAGFSVHVSLPGQFTPERLGGQVPLGEPLRVPIRDAIYYPEGLLSRMEEHATTMVNLSKLLAP